MVNTPPSTGNAQLDRFLRSVADDLRTLAKPREGWRLSDFAADVSEVISDRRDLIDIVSAWGRIEDLEDSLAEQPGGLVGTFSSANMPSANNYSQGVWVYNTTLSKPFWSDGAQWRDAAGEILSS